MRDATRLIHAVYGDPQPGDAFLPGPVFASTYRHAGDPTGAAFTYGRTTNPTWAAYEEALSILEGGPALVFASGMAAVAAVLCSTLRPDDVVLMPADGYYGARGLTTGYLTELGVDVRLVRSADLARDPAAFTGARLAFFESPSNPRLDVCDLAALAAAAHDAGALVAVDNTTATALGQRPLALGADFSVSSDTKAMSGHSDLLLGHVAVGDASLLTGLAAWRSQVGAVAGPMETWLAHRSLATLDVRLQRQCSTALAVATALREQPAVLSCRYPVLPGDPAHELAARQMALFGSVLNFTLTDQAAAEHWLDAVRLIVPATSFGGVHSTAERRARWAGDDVPAGFIRLSIGLEDPADLTEDVLQALP